MAAGETDPTGIHCTRCGRKIGVATSPNSDLYETGEVAHEVRLHASVNAPMVSMNVLLAFECERCSGKAATDQAGDGA